MLFSGLPSVAVFVSSERGTMADFDYILDKLKAAEFQDAPFKHIYLTDVFSEAHFREIIKSPEVSIPPVDSDEELIDALYRQNFKEITFPGTTTDIESYLKWHKDPSGLPILNQSTCEGYGVVMRLRHARHGTILHDAHKFFLSERFWLAMSEKFDVDYSLGRIDVGLQKYLDGYEISPHPDIRLKALTFMVNINPAEKSESIDYHTKYMTFRPEREYVRTFWSREKTVDRCWVPWDWCETKKTQVANNSMVMFSPADDTLHAVKVRYDHLVTQRTQFYGNLWYNESKTVLTRYHPYLATMATQRETV